MLTGPNVALQAQKYREGPIWMSLMNDKLC